MSGYRRVNYYELCRLCTSSEGSKMHIFREEGKRRQLSSKIQSCLPLQVNEEDSLPKIVCNNCVEKLESFFVFRSSCVNAEAMLEGYFTSLRYNNDFSKEGKVYIKDVSPSKMQNCENGKRVEVSSSQLPLPEALQLQIGMSDREKGPPPSQTVASVPVTLDNLNSLVQAATIRIVSGQTEPDDSRLQVAVQIQPGPVVEPSNNESRFTFQSCNNTSISTTNVLKSMHTQQSYASHSKNKSVDEEHRVEEESSEDGENESSLQPTIAFSSGNTAQDVLVHFGFNKDKEGTSNVFHTSDSINRASVVQIGEFLRMKTVEIETGGEAINTEIESSGSCEHCGKELSEEQRENHSLSCPSMTENTSEEKTNITYRCDICPKLFKRKEHLFQHKKLHTGERPYICGNCGKAFSRKEHLVRHSVSHTGQKQYSCDICGKSFGRKDNVRKHRKTHGLSGPFVCETCGKTFVVKPYYLMHKASHCTGSDPDSTSFPYRCDICNKGFTVKHYLTTHKLRHRNKVSAAAADSTEHSNLDLPPVQEVTILPPNIMHESNMFQATTTSAPATFICTPANQLLAYRKLNQT